MKEKIQLNVLGDKLITCSKEPLTGFRRNGCCDAHESDYGKHLICAILNEKFLEFQFSKGNDLITPKKEIELIEIEPKNYIVIENPNSDISLGVEVTKK